MKNGIVKGITAILIAGVLAAGVCCTGFASRDENGKWFGNSDLTTWHWTDKTDDKEPVGGENKPGGDSVESDSADLLFGTVESYGLQLMSSKVETLSAMDFVSYVVTAAVIPSDAENQAVDWVLRAGENFEGDINDCLTVVPTEDGSLAAVVTCKKAFTGVINLIVTTRDGGFSAVCAVTFVGKPAWISVDTSSLPRIYDSGWDVDIYELKTSTQFSLSLSLSNVYGVVDSSISPNYYIDVIPHGEFYVRDYCYGKGSVSNEVHKVVPVNYTTAFVEGEHAYLGGEVKNKFYIAQNLYELNLDYHTFNIKTFSRTPASYDMNQALNAQRTEYESVCFDHYAEESKLPNMEIVVSDRVTNLSTSINVRICSTITGVTVDKAELEF